VCVCVCVCACVCAHLGTYLCVCVHLGTHLCVCASWYIYMCVCVRVCVRILVHICVCVHASWYISVCVHRSVGPRVVHRAAHEALPMRGRRVAAPPCAAAPGEGNSSSASGWVPRCLAQPDCTGKPPGCSQTCRPVLFSNLSSEVCCRKHALSILNHAAQRFTLKKTTFSQSTVCWQRLRLPSSYRLQM